MAEINYSNIPVISKIKIGNVTYWVKDADARSLLEDIDNRVLVIEGDYLKAIDKQNLQTQISTNATDIAAIISDYLKSADKTELQNLITTEEQRASSAETELGGRIAQLEVLPAKDITSTQITNWENEVGAKSLITAETARAEGAEQALDAKINALKTIEIKVVDVLPETGESNIIYLVPKEEGKPGYKEFVWVESQNKFEEIGDTDIDLSNYYTKAEVDAKLENIRVNENTFIFQNDLETMYTLGKYNGTLANPQTIPAAGKTFAAVWDTIFKKEENPATTQPSLTINSSNIGAKEVGTNIAIAYTTTFNAGSYTYGPATGVTASDYKIKFNGETLTSTSGTFASVQVQDSTSLKITGTYDHTAGTMPVTNIGNNYPAGQIAAANDKAATEKGTLTGYRNMFYGTVTNKNEITSTIIRSLTSVQQAAKAKNALDVSIPVGALRVIIAVPNDRTTIAGKSWTRTVTSIHDRNGLGAEILSSFTETNIVVTGANDFTGINYKVYYLDYANPNNKANHYDVTVG